MNNNEWKHMQVQMVSELQLECSILITMLQKILMHANSDTRSRQHTKSNLIYQLQTPNI